MSSSPPVGSRAGWGRSRNGEGAPALHSDPLAEAEASPGSDEVRAGRESRGLKQTGLKQTGLKQTGLKQSSGTQTGTRPARDNPSVESRAGESEAESAARAIALAQLTTSARSRAQLAEAMAKKDIPPEVAERILDRFVEVGLIDDAEYAAMLVRTRHAERGLARRALAQELSRKGIDQETAELALAQVTPEDEHSAALDLVRRRAGATRGKPIELRTRRLVSMLARKGHSMSSAYRIVAEVLAQEQASDDIDHAGYDHVGLDHAGLDHAGHDHDLYAGADDWSL